MTPLLLEAQDHVGGRGSGERVDGFSLDMGAFVFTSTYDTAFRLCGELGLPLVPSQMKFGHHRNGRWVTTTPDQSLWNFIRHLRTAITMGFLSPAGMRAGFRVMREIRRQTPYMSFASDSPIAEIDDDESFHDYMKRLNVPENLRLTLRAPLEMILGDPEPAGQALMRAYIGETMLHDGRVSMPERGIGSLSRALATHCADAIRVSTPVSRIVVSDGKVTGVINGRRDDRGGRGHLRRPRHEGCGPRSRATGSDSPRARRHQLLNRLSRGDRPGPLPAPSRLARRRSFQRTTTPRSCSTGRPSCPPARRRARAFSTC